MIKKIIFIFIFSLTVYGCGYTPIYSLKNNKAQFKIESISFKEGDNILNNYLNIYLKRYSVIEKDLKFFLSIKTEYQKLTISKDTTGKATEYELVADVKTSVTHNGLIVKEFSIVERLIIDNNNNQFEESSYERTIKQNFASSIAEKLIMRLTDIQITSDGLTDIQITSDK